MPRGRRGQAVEPTKSAIDEAAKWARLGCRLGASVKAVQRQLGHATASITLDTYGQLFPDELDALAGRLEDARTDALATLAWTQRRPAVLPLREGAGQ
jgi:hypothetical protein